MAQNRSDNFNITAPKSVDNRYLKNGTTPYASVAEAHGILTYRYVGLTVLILKNGVPTEYWYKSSIASASDLVEKAGVDQEALAAKVDKEVGKVLSTNDYTTTDKTKLAGIQAGATANASDVQLRDRSTHTGTQPVSTITGLAPVATAGTYASLTGKPNIPVNLDQLPDSTTRFALTAADRVKLATLSGTNTGDETASTIKSKLGIVNISGTNTGDQDISGISLNTAAIGSLSTLSTSVKTNLVAAINEVKSIADTAAGGGTIVGDGTVTDAKFSADVKVGSLALLTTAAKSNVVSAINELNSTKVTKVTGKQLSTEDYTTAEKAKLATIASSATANSTDTFLLNRINHVGTQPATTITEDSSHRFVSDTEKAAWSAKQDAGSVVTLTGTQTLTNKTLSGPVISTILNGAATITLPTITGTLALTSQITGTNSGVNTGDETAATIKSKLGITTLSGSNTGDQIISDATISTSDITTNNVSITKHGFVPKAPNDATKFLNGLGAWAVPAGGGGGDVTASGVQTLTNKTLDGVNNTFTNIPASAIKTTDTQTLDVATLATKAGAETLTNKIIDGNNNTIQNVRATSILDADKQIFDPTSYGDRSLRAQLKALGSPIKGVSVGCSYFPQGFYGVNMYLGGEHTFSAMYFLAGDVVTGLDYIMFRTGAYSADDFNGIGLYSFSGGTLTLVASSTNIPNLWQAAAKALITVNFTTPYTIPSSGIYYAAAMYSASAETVTPQIATIDGSYFPSLNYVGFANGAFINGKGGFTASLITTVSTTLILKESTPDPTWVGWH